VAATPEALSGYDLVLIGTDHDGVDYGAVVANAALVVDTRNATARMHGRGGRVVALSALPNDGGYTASAPLQGAGR